MKYISFFVLVFGFALNNYAQTTAIPDPNFEQELVNQGIDSNGINGNILDADAQIATNLTLAGTAINDITGISAFINLTSLDLGNNQVINVSLTALTQLTNFRTNDNQALASVDFGQNALLESVFMHGDFPGTPPPITTIDLSQNLNLVSFNGDFLDNVTNIIFPATNTLTDLYLRYLADMTIDLSLLGGLERFTIGGWRSDVNITFPNVHTSLRELTIYSIDIPTIDISNYTNLEDLFLWGTYVENLLLPTSTTLTDIFIILHDIQNPLDFSIVPNLIDLDITSNDVTPLVVDLTQNLVLEDVDLSRNDMNSIDVTQNVLLEQLRVNNNNLTALDVTQNVILNRLSARDNQLPAVDLTQNITLEYLTLSYNLIPTLDITQNIILRSAYIDNNLFTTTGLDLTQNADLYYLNASFNQIESLNILQNPEMSFLIINNNLFTGTDILEQYHTVNGNRTYQLISGNLIVHDNMLSGIMPDFTSIMNIDSSTPNLMTRNFVFEFYNNNFEFGHFENQHSDYTNYESIFIPAPYNSFVIQSYLYAPQAKVDVIETINANAGDALTLTTICAGAQNHYTWFKDGVAIPGAPDSPNYTIPSVNSCDQAVYHSEITSDLVPFENTSPPGTDGKNLLLIRNDITLNVTSPIESCTSLVSPADGSTNVALNEVLTWLESLGACGYFISLGTTSGGTDILNNVDVGNVTEYATTTDLPPNTQIFVTITPYFANGTVLSCPEESFTTGTTTVTADCTSLTSPLNGDIDVPVDTDLSWNPVANATYYRLSIGTISGTYTILTGAAVGAATTYDITGLLPENTVIYVLIVPYNSAGDSIGCIEESFTTIQLCNITADILPNVTECDSYTLPTLTVGNYFTASGGTGTALNAGDIINTIQTIYIYANNGSCSDESSFDVTINTTPSVDILTDATACDSYILAALTTGNYFTASGGTGTMLNAGDTITTSQTIFIYSETGTTPNCSDESSFDITINAAPTVDTLNDETACDSFTLPTLTTGNYFTASGGTGTPLNAGDNITTSQTIYIYETNGNCSDESSFDITINITPSVDILTDETACDSYTLTTLTVGNYFTASGGTGTPLNAGDAITTSQTIYVYDTNGNCFDESSFDIIINQTPNVPNLTNETRCDSYTLPVIPNGNYFTATGGTGTQLNAGDAITTTQSLFIYEAVGTTPNICFDESSFVVTINQSPVVDVLNDVTSCDNYILPVLTVGDYYSGINGTGTQYNAGDAITTTQTIYVFEQTATNPNCTDESSFNVTINTTPIADVLANVTACDNYTLQPLTNGNYFTGPNGTGTQLNAGDTIALSQTIYIYAETATTPNCSNESSFTVTINTTPTVTILNDEIACDSFTLQTLVAGNYFSGPNGTGTQLNPNDVITTSQTIYIYNETGTTPNCSDESSFTVTINTTPAVDTLEDVSACTIYTLPSLTNGTFYSGPNGTGTQFSAGDTIGVSLTLYIYAESGTTPNCTNESSLEVTINPVTDFSLTEDNIEIDEQDIIVTMTDTSINYEYAVDSGSFQSSNQFFDLPEGNHTLYVRDANGCVEKLIQFEIIIIKFNIPKYFTPNNDGYHDTWQVLDNQNTIQDIYIFDRYGKLLKQIIPNSEGWDGTYRGRGLEVNDYWYTITLRSGKIIRGHFTLKR